MAFGGNVIGATILEMAVNTKAWHAGLSNAEKRFVAFGASLRVTGFRMAAVLTTTLVALGGAVLKFGAEFERAFAGVTKTLEISGKDSVKILGFIEQGILELSRSTPFAAAELANFARIGAQLGVGSENLLGFTKTIAKLSVAVQELDPEKAARGLARLTKVTGGSEADFDRLGSVLAKLGDNFATTEEHILSFATRAAGLARISDITATDLLGIAAAFTSVREQTESGATAVSKALGIIIEAVSSGEGKLEELAVVAGMTAEQFQKAWREDAAMALVTVIDNLGAMGEKGVAALKAIGLNNERAKQTFLALAGASGEARRGIELARKEFEENVKLDREFAVVMGTLTEQMNVLGQRIKFLAIDAYKKLREEVGQVIGIFFTLVDLAGVLFDAFFSLDKGVRNQLILWGGLAAVLGPVLLAVGAIVSMLAAFSSVAVAVIAVVGGLIAAFALVSPEALSASNIILLLAEAMLRTVSVAQGLKLILLGVVDAILSMSQAWLKYTPAGIIANKLFGDLATSAKEMQTEIRTTMTEGFIDRDKLKADLNEARNEIISFVSKLKQEGGLGIGEILEGSEAKLAIIEEALAKLGDTGEKAGGEAADGVRDFAFATDDAKDKAKAFADKLEEINLRFAELGFGIDEASGRMNLSMKELDLYGSLLELSPQALLQASSSLVTVTEQLISDLGGVIEGPLRAELVKKFTKLWEDLTAAGQGFMADQIREFAAGALGADILPQTFEGPLPEDVTEKTERFRDVLSSLVDVFKLLGVSADSAFGRILGAIGVASDAGQQLRGMLFNAEGDFKGLSGKDAGAAIQAGAQGAAAIASATGSGSRGERQAGGALAGAEIGGQIMPGIGHAIGAGIGFIVGSLRGKTTLAIMADIGAKWGVEISEELAKEIEQSMKDLDLAQLPATFLHFADILAEAGGVTASNMDTMVARFGNLVGFVESGTIGMAEGLEAIGEGFAAMLPDLQALGTEGSLAIGKIVRQLHFAGLATDEVNEHLAEQGNILMTVLAPALQWIIDLEDMTAKEAEALQGVVIAAFGGAVAATGSFIEAVATLGETFREALRKIADSLGPDGENLIGPIRQIYNTISNNQESFNALAGIVAGLDAMAQMGILTKNSLAAMGAAIEVTFNRLLDETGNLKATIRATWPELIKLYEWYQKLGLDAPAWLQDVIDQGSKMGLSLDVPDTVLSVLQDIATVLGDIAIALGAVTIGANNAGAALGGIDVPNGTSSESDSSEHAQEEGFNAAGGLHIPMITQPVFGPIFAHAGERVDIDTPENMPGGGNTFAPSINIVISDPMASADDIQRKVVPVMIDAIRKDYKSFVGEMQRKLERS